MIFTDSQDSLQQRLLYRDDGETLALTAASQKCQANAKVKDAERIVDLRVQETLVHALVSNLVIPTADISWYEIRISGTERCYHSPQQHRGSGLRVFCARG